MSNSGLKIGAVMKKSRLNANCRPYSTKWTRRRLATGMTSVTLKSKKTSRFSIMPSGCAGLLRARSAEGPRHSFEFLAPVGLVLDRHVLQPVSARWNRGRHHQELLLAQRNARQEGGRAAIGAIRPIYRSRRAGRHHWRPHQFAL